jgi:hypothetical protein
LKHLNHKDGRRHPREQEPGGEGQEELETMVTNYPPSIASHEGLRTTSGQTQEDGFGGRMLEWLRQTFCSLHGHDTMLHFQQTHMSLRCVSCGHETPGWSLDEVPPTVTIRGDARRLAMVRPQLVSARRIA